MGHNNCSICCQAIRQRANWSHFFWNEFGRVVAWSIEIRSTVTKHFVVGFLDVKYLSQLHLFLDVLCSACLMLSVVCYECPFISESVFTAPASFALWRDNSHFCVEFLTKARRVKLLVERCGGHKTRLLVQSLERVETFV